LTTPLRHLVGARNDERMNSDVFFLNIFTQELFNRIYAGKYTINMFDFHFCYISSSFDVVYKGRWLTQAGYWFILRLCEHFTCLSNDERMNSRLFFKYFYAGIVQSNLYGKIHNKYVFHANIHIFVLKYLAQRNKYLRQPSIDFDFCNKSSSCDVVYKGRWLTQAGYWFILRLCEHFTCIWENTQ
jgi:hypothetical protein